MKGRATHFSILAWRTPWTEKPGGIQSMMSKIMTSNPITSWQIEGGKVETLTDFIFLGSKITVDDNCSHKIKRRLLLRRKAVTNLGSVLKSRDIMLPTKICVVKAMVFPVVLLLMWEFSYKEGWVPKNWCFQIGVLENGEDSWESLGQPGNQIS